MIEWRKSSRSGTSGGDCVEVANLAGNIAVRDSKAPQAGHVTLPAGSFTDLVARIKAGELDL
jgi:formylmethanofuran dehydrogenase subunit D